MLKLDYFLKVVNSETHKSRDWIISAFSIQRYVPQLSEVTYPWALIKDSSDEDKYFVAVPTEDGYVSEKIEDSDINLPLFQAKEPCDIPANSLPLENEACNTTYGIILGNMFLLYYPFKNKFKFLNNMISSDMDFEISQRLVDNVANPKMEENDKIYVREYLAYGEACNFISSLDHLFASSGSLAAMSVSDDVIKLRDNLIKENKDNLHDRVVQAKIEEAVVAADKASFAGDEDAKDYLVSGKAFNPTRKKQLILIGGSSGFGDAGEASFIPTSLKDGWRKEDIAIHANEARAGSYFRGKETQFGGADVKVANRIMMNSRIEEEFCGTTRGKKTIIREKNKFMYIGLYLMTKQDPVLITKDNVNQLVDKEVYLYSPQYCMTAGASYCATCIGRTYSRLPNGIPSVVTNIYDIFMYDKMKRMHGKATNTVVVDPWVIAS